MKGVRTEKGGRGRGLRGEEKGRRGWGKRKGEGVRGEKGGVRCELGEEKRVREGIN